MGEARRRVGRREHAAWGGRGGGGGSKVAPVGDEEGGRERVKEEERTSGSVRIKLRTDLQNNPCDVLFCAEGVLSSTDS